MSSTSTLLPRCRALSTRSSRPTARPQRCDNPHDYPSPDVIEEAREPYVKASIMTPQEFVGNIMPMCQDRRGIF